MEMGRRVCFNTHSLFPLPLVCKTFWAGRDVGEVLLGLKGWSGELGALYGASIIIFVFWPKPFEVLCRQRGQRQRQVFCRGSQACPVAERRHWNVSKISWCRWSTHKTSRLTPVSATSHMGGPERLLLCLASLNCWAREAYASPCSTLCSCYTVFLPCWEKPHL